MESDYRVNLCEMHGLERLHTTGTNKTRTRVAVIGTAKPRASDSGI
jgi:hypothetical protein